MPAARRQLSPPPAADPALLPNGDSSDLELVIATSEEVEHTILLNSVSWAGPLSADAYLRREEHLSATDLSKDGGISNWVLVSKHDHQSPRTILAACESIRKRALVASKQTGEVKDSWAFGIGSVYCRNEYRGKGYALRMMAELRKKLEFWQQEHNSKADFTVLYSDIGKKFYAKNGWIPYASSHVSLSPKAEAKMDNRVQLLRANDLPELCRKDEQVLRQVLGDFSSQSHEFRLAWIPDIATMTWHHAREEFLASELLEKTPEIKGALIKSETGASTWCIWSRIFSKNQKENVLYILRIVVEGEDHTGKHLNPQHVEQVAACLSAAQEQANQWGMQSVDIRNPSSTVMAACQQLRPGLELIHRDQESIACLNWYGEQPGLDRIEWVANEKFGWC